VDEAPRTHLPESLHSELARPAVDKHSPTWKIRYPAAFAARRTQRQPMTRPGRGEEGRRAPRPRSTELPGSGESRKGEAWEREEEEEGGASGRERGEE